MVKAAADRRAGTLPADTASALGSVVAALYADYGESAAFTRAAPTDDRLALLGEVVGLDEPARELLTAAAAPDLDSNIGLAYDLLAGRAAAGRASVSLALELSGVPSADAFAVLHPAAPLRRSGLLDIDGDGAWLRRAVRVPDRVTAHLVGVDAPVESVAAIAVDALPFACPASAQLARAVASGATLVWVRSLLGTVGVSVAVAGFAEVGLGSLVVDARRIAGGTRDVLAAAAREAAFAGAALVVTGADVLGDPEQQATLGVLADAAVPVAAVGIRSWHPAWLRTIPLTVDAPLLTGADRAGIWTQAIGVGLPSEPGHPALSTLRLTPEEILATARYARVLASARDEDLSSGTLRDAARLLSAGAGIGAGAGRVAARPTGAAASFDDLVLPDRIKADLQRLIRWAAHRDEVLARGPVHGKGGKGTGITALFTGSPGTGKTLAAHVVADELNLELFQVDLSAVVDKYIGETEKNLERIFHEAETRNVVLFFDAADALFGSRSEVRDAHDRYANQEVSYLLQRMEQFDGITVLATNLRGNLDPAFSRRMQFIVHFPDPDAATRRRLWEQHLSNAGPLDEDDPVDVELLSDAVELAGGDIRNVVLGATYDAASNGEPVGMRHVRAATGREYQKLGRRAPAGGFDG